ncbi:MAG: tetratricopeptide repeat protein, partial [Planctomycetes bacterium]|nr:tetratricopeptide repeat protein [Planctomycetota bacterium]
YLDRAAFYGALVLSEEGRFADAVTQLAAMAQQYPKSPLLAEAQLRRGYCQMQLKNYPQAIADLQPLTQNAELADRAMWWLARSQVSAADPKNAQVYQQALAAAVAALRGAADRAGAQAGADPEAKVRRGDILLELADTQQLAGQYPEAAATYQQVLAEKNNPDRLEEAMQRLATALHLAGKYPESDAACKQFESAYPKSTLLPAVRFRAAENAYLAAMRTADAADAASRRDEINRLFDGVVQRYEALVKQFPEFPYVNVARQALATAHYRADRYPQAVAILSAIPEAERTGDLAAVPYLLADCLIRGLSDEADDAIQAARLIERAEQAAKLLEGFVGSAGKTPEAADALLKLGHCYQRIGAVLADPAERQKVLSQARGAYERALPLLGKDVERQATAVFERAKCLALMGDPGTAHNELGRFQGDPLRGTAIAPVALVRLSVLLRAQNKAVEAANLWNQHRATLEAALAKDPARRDGIAMLQYEHAVALKESGKAPEALALFDAVAKQFAGRPEAVNAVWRAGQCRREKLAADLDAARQAADKPGATPEQVAAAGQAVKEATAGLRQVMGPLQALADQLGKTAAKSDPHLRMLYELAWCHRVLADSEVLAARQKLEREAVAKVQAALAKATPDQPPPSLRAPDIPASAIPMQPSETAAREQYKRLIAAGPRAVLAVQARLELAELESQRGQTEAALDLLADALAANVPAD